LAGYVIAGSFPLMLKELGMLPDVMYRFSQLLGSETIALFVAGYWQYDSDPDVHPRIAR
jgi:hypothetical protein